MGAEMMGTSARSGVESADASSLMGLPVWPVGEVERAGPWMFGWGEGVTCGMLLSSSRVSQLVWGRQVTRGLLFGVGNGGADCGLRSHASLGEGIVTRVKVLAILQWRTDIASMLQRGRAMAIGTHLLDFSQHVLVCGQLAVQTEELLLLFSHRLRGLVSISSRIRQHKVKLTLMSTFLR